MTVALTDGERELIAADQMVDSKVGLAANSVAWKVCLRVAMLVDVLDLYQVCRMACSSAETRVYWTVGLGCGLEGLMDYWVKNSAD